MVSESPVLLENILQSKIATTATNPQFNKKEHIALNLIESTKSALNGNNEGLNKILSVNCTWGNPFVNNIADFKESVKQFSSFFNDISIMTFNITLASPNSFEVVYQISFWYPLPWRPRVIIPCKAIINFDEDSEKIISVEETWEISLLEIFFRLFPRFWDSWHVYSTPTPEYPPIKKICAINGVSFEELPQTVCVEVTWHGPAKFAGPPLLVAPSFSLFGSLRTSKPNREKYLTVLPVEVKSAKYKDLLTYEDMKTSSWIFHVPTSLQEKVIDKAKLETVYSLKTSSYETELDISNTRDDLMDEVDYQVGIEALQILKNPVDTDVIRGDDLELNKKLLLEFQSKEKKEYKYSILPKRLIAKIDLVADEFEIDKISNAIKKIKNVMNDESTLKKLKVNTLKLKSYSITNTNEFDNNEQKPKLSIHNDERKEKEIENNNNNKKQIITPELSLFLWSTKGCFNSIGEPAMAIYENQYNFRKISVFLELLTT
jgi:hypothetical protein